MHIHIHHHYDDKILKRLEQIMSALDDLQAAVANEDTVIASAIKLIQGIPALIAAAGIDPVKLAALQADITDHANALANAVATAPGQAPVGGTAPVASAGTPAPAPAPDDPFATKP
jgi:flagellin-like hook-associated protein FlgL